MAFAVFADGSANLPKKFLGNIRLLPCHYTRNNENKVYTGDVDQFDGHSFYEDLRNGTVVKTSLLNTKLFIDQFTPLLKQGLDVVYVSMSSGISGTYNAARLAAQELMEQYKGRFVHIVDSLGCGFGNGILAMEADELSQDGKDARSAAQILDEDVPHICQYFTVDDLNFLKKTGQEYGEGGYNDGNNQINQWIVSALCVNDITGERFAQKYWQSNKDMTMTDMRAVLRLPG